MSKVENLKNFRNMPQEKHKEISSLGGLAVPREKRSFSRNRELAREAGRKGGMAVAASKRSFFVNKELAKAASVKGAKVRNRATVDVV